MVSRVLLHAGPVTGIAFVVLSTVGLLIHGYPENSPGAVKDWVIKTDPVRFAFGIWLEGFAFMLFLPFAAWLLRILQRPGAARWPADVAMGSAVLATGSALLINGIWTAVLDAGRAEGIESEALYVVRVVAQDTFNASLFFYAFFALGTAVLALIANSLRRWLSWSALAIGVALLIPVANFAGALALEVWIVVVCVMHLRRTESEATLTN